jgi:hypothetical protein
LTADLVCSRFEWVKPLLVQEEQHELTAERVARNDARFRESNEQLLAVSEALDFGSDELLPFLCECADVQCTTIVQLTGREYEHVRRSPVQFINARGHEENAQGWARVVDEFDRYTIVEKVGAAGELAAELDQRRGDRDERA